MLDELKLIKKKYGEKMMHFCRSTFPTLLETPGLLFNLLSDNFAYSKFLYDDIVGEGVEQEFQDYIYSLTNIVDIQKRIIVDKSPEELLAQKGYILYECKTEEDIQKFKKYYDKDEELCTFRKKRLDYSYVFFAVKKNIDEIKREDFPTRQDTYGTSVISIQFSKGEENVVSIKNRYNHTVTNPDATFNNNLDNIIEGLTESFCKKYKLNITKRAVCDFELRNYVRANDGKYYKYNYEENNIYYCPNNIIIDNFEVKKFPKEKYIVMDYFILDLVNKNIILYDKKLKDSFVNDFNGVNKFDIKNDKQTGNKNIYVYYNNGKKAIIKLNKENQIIKYENDTVLTIEDNYLFLNETLEKIKLNNVLKIGDNFLKNNYKNLQLIFPMLMSIGDNFLYWNTFIEMLYFPNLEKIGNKFLYNARYNLLKLEFPNLKIVGDEFLFSNDSLEIISFPNLEIIGDDFLYNNVNLLKFDLRNLKNIGNDFMYYNEGVEEINCPKLEIVGSNFFYSNKNKLILFLNSLKCVNGDDFLINAMVEDLEFPELETVGAGFLYYNKILKTINIPKLKYIGDGFLFYYCYYNNDFYHQIINMIKQRENSKEKILLKKNGN